jgi:signal transduction histidine kinase
MNSSLKPFLGWRSPGWGKAPSLAFAGTVLIAYLSSLWDGSIQVAQHDGALCVALGAVYAAVGMFDFVYFCHEAGNRARVLYLCAQSALLLGIFWTSRLNGQIPICVYPMVAATVAILRPAAATAGVLLLYGMVLAVEGHFYGGHAAGRWSISMIPSFGFVVVFTELAVLANGARKRAETLAAEVEKLAVIRERNRLAGEIHDSLGHYLTTIHVQLQGARAVHAADPGRALEAVAKAQGLANDALAEVRRSVGALRADRGSAALADSLRDLASATDGWGAAVSLEILGGARTLAPEADHALFRAAQEGLTNVRRHAQARTARVTLDFRDRSWVVVRVADDGRGARGGGDGCGLANLRERISPLGGSVSAENAPGGGFRLEVKIPA